MYTCNQEILSSNKQTVMTSLGPNLFHVKKSNSSMSEHQISLFVIFWLMDFFSL